MEISWEIQVKWKTRRFQNSPGALGSTLTKSVGQSENSGRPLTRMHYGEQNTDEAEECPRERSDSTRNSIDSNTKSDGKEHLVRRERAYWLSLSVR